MEMEIGEKKEIIRERVRELIEKMGILAEVSISESQTGEEDANLTVDIKTKDSNYLIGQYGINLQALQHMARVIVRKQIQEKTNFILDVNAYRREKNESIAALAKNMADQSVLEKRAVVMRPMSAYERRLIHVELAKDERIKTESIGVGEDRRVVIKPAELI
jgi:spoIIIJ-associated protein